MESKSAPIEATTQQNADGTYTEIYTLSGDGRFVSLFFFFANRIVY